MRKTHFQIQRLLKIWKNALESMSYDVSITFPLKSTKDLQWLTTRINNITTQVARACPDHLPTLLCHNYTL